MGENLRAFKILYKKSDMKIVFHLVKYFFLKLCTDLLIEKQNKFKLKY